MDKVVKFNANEEQEEFMSCVLNRISNARIITLLSFRVKDHKFDVAK